VNRLGYLLFLHGVASRFPFFKPAKKRMNVRPTVVHQFDRRTGARRFVRSGTVRDNRFAFRERPDALIDFIERHSNGSLNLVFRSLPWAGIPDIQKYDFFAESCRSLASSLLIRSESATKCLLGVNLHSKYSEELKACLMTLPESHCPHDIGYARMEFCNLFSLQPEPQPFRFVASGSHASR
jgi:hypothetical protein